MSVVSDQEQRFIDVFKTLGRLEFQVEAQEKEIKSRKRRKQSL